MVRLLQGDRSLLLLLLAVTLVLVELISAELYLTEPSLDVLLVAEVVAEVECLVMWVQGR